MSRPGLAVGLLALALGACSSDDANASGVLIDMEGDLTTVQSFTLLTAEGECTFSPAEGLTFHDSPLSHLSSHLVSGEPIDVEYQAGDDGTKIATAVQDAG